MIPRLIFQVGLDVKMLFMYIYLLVVIAILLPM